MSFWRHGLIGQSLRADGVIAYPTEGVWGLGCLPESHIGVGKILDLKERHWSQGLLLVAASIDQFSPYLTGLPSDRMARLNERWPGHTTFLVPDNGTAPAWIVGHHDTLGLRVSTHPLVQKLCAAFGPLVSTSANISGRPAALTAFEVRRYFGSMIEQIVPGSLGGADGPSRIENLVTGEVIR